MWMTPKLAVGPGERNSARRTGNMAHRKGLITARVGAVLLAGLLLAVLLAGRMVLLNQMTVMRTNIAVMEDRKDFLETKSADLLARWNQETSAQVICARAEKELGLRSPEQPGLVLVKLPADPGKSRWGWPRWLESIGGGDPAQAGELGTGRADGQMVYLVPSGRSSADTGENTR